MFSLSSTKIFLLRAVVALCVLLLCSFPYPWPSNDYNGAYSGQAAAQYAASLPPMLSRELVESPDPGLPSKSPSAISVSYWFPLIMIALILVHRFLMSLNMNFLHGLVDLAFLVPEIIGFALYNQPFKFTTSGHIQFSKSPVIAILVKSTTFIFLCLEAILRIGCLIRYIAQCCHKDPSPSRQYISLLEPLAEEDLPWYQVIFGRSMSGTHFTNPMELSAQYYISINHMKLTLVARTILLRLVLVLSFTSLVLLASVQYSQLRDADHLWIQLLVFITLHHLFSCINMEFNYGIADFPFLVLEIAIIAPIIIQVGSFDPASPSSLICYTFFFWVIFIGLCLETLIWVVSTIIYVTKHTRLCLDTPGSMKQEFYKPHQVLFGHSLWKTYLSGEMRIMVASRGLVAATVLFMVFFYSVVAIILGPIQESGLTPTKELRSLNLPSYLKDTKNDVWNVVFKFPFSQSWNLTFQDAVNVTSSWYDNLNASCVPISQPLTKGSTYSYATFYCGLYPYDVTELLVTVNFATLPPVYPRNSLQMMIGFTNHSDIVVERTTSTTLLPGTNLVVEVTSELRQLIKRPSSVFGLFESYETVRVAKVLNVYPDPLVSDSPLIMHSRNSSTFRVFMQENEVSEKVVMQDYSSKSVLQGFSSVGGLWTFLSGIFAVIFGNSILRILFGFKPLSFSGLAHLMQRQKIRDACLQEYPRISEQIAQPNSEKGLLSLVCDQLIALDFFEVEKKADDTNLPKNEPNS